MSTGQETATERFDAVISTILECDDKQLSRAEYRYVAGLVAARAGCNLLVFGVGNDSKLWLLANRTGRTVFLESSRFWADMIGWRYPGIDIRMVRYGTRQERWRELLDGPATALVLDLPEDVDGGRWDVIFVDGPTAYAGSCPGRMKSIYTAAALAHRWPGTDVVVHDCDRESERAYCDRFLGGALLVREFERTRHYRTQNEGGVIPMKWI